MKTVLLALLFPVLVQGEKLDYEAVIEAAEEAKKGEETPFSFCRCQEIEGGGECSNECFMFCSFSGALSGAKQAIDDKCEETSSEEEAVVKDKTAGMMSLSSVYSKAEKKIQKLQKKPLPEDEDCAHCEPVSKVVNQTQPYIFTEESCDKKYIKTHKFRREREEAPDKKGKCSEKQINRLRKRLQQYGANLITGGGKKGDAETKAQSKALFEVCPDNCSFYTSSVININENSCRGAIDMFVNCNHQKELSLFSGEYVVRITYQKQRRCAEEN